MTEDQIIDLLSSNLSYILLALLLFIVIFQGVKIVPQSEQHVVERFGRLRSVLGPGINFIVPFLDKIRHRVSILERQLPNASQDAITRDNVLVEVETSVFYRITNPEKTVYRIRDVDAAIATTVAGIVRAEIGKMDLDDVQANRSQLIDTIKQHVEDAVDNWGIEVTRAETTCGVLDETARTMLEAAGHGDAFVHGLGHGVGLEIHEAPIVSVEPAARLRPSTALTVEPGVYLAASADRPAGVAPGGVRIEDTVVVTSDGPAEVLTAAPHALQVVPG